MIASKSSSVISFLHPKLTLPSLNSALYPPISISLSALYFSISDGVAFLKSFGLATPSPSGIHFNHSSLSGSIQVIVEIVPLPMSKPTWVLVSCKAITTSPTSNSS